MGPPQTLMVHIMAVKACNNLAANCSSMYRVGGFVAMGWGECMSFDFVALTTVMKEAMWYEL